MLPKSFFRPTCLLPLLGLTLVSATCEGEKLDDNPARAAFQKGYVYLNPADKLLYAVDTSNPEEPFLLTQREGIREFNLSRDGRQVAFVAEDSVGEQLYIISIQGGAERLLVPASALATGSTLAAPAFSPSGKQVAFGFSDRPGSLNVGIVYVDGSGLRRVNPDLGLFQGTFSSPNFLDEQTLWAAGTRNGNLLLTKMDASSGAELFSLTQAGLVPLAPSSRLVLSPDGNHVAWAGNTSGGTRIFVWGLNTGTVRQLTEGDGADTMPSWKDKTTVLWTRASSAYSAPFGASKTAGTLELENAVNAAYGPLP